MLQVNELDQYYGGSHILRGLTFEARVGGSHLFIGPQWCRQNHVAEMPDRACSD